MKWALAKDYEILQAEDRAGAIEKLSFCTSCRGFAGLGFAAKSGANPGGGLAILSDLLAVSRSAKIIIVTGQGEKEFALRAIGAGAYDF